MAFSSLTPKLPLAGLCSGPLQQYVIHPAEPRRRGHGKPRFLQTTHQKFPPCLRPRSLPRGAENAPCVHPPLPGELLNDLMPRPIWEARHLPLTDKIRRFPSASHGWSCFSGELICLTM